MCILSLAFLSLTVSACGSSAATTLCCPFGLWASFGGSGVEGSWSTGSASGTHDLIVGRK